MVRMDQYTKDKKLIASAMKRVTTIGREKYNIEKEAAKLWKLLEPYHKGARQPRIEMMTRGCRVDREGLVWQGIGGAAGLADYNRWTVMLKVAPSYETLAHELVHFAVGTRGVRGRREVHDRVFYNCLKDVLERRFKIHISFYEVSRYGYEVDGIIEEQLYEKDVFRVFRKEPKPTEEGAQ
jgi:hypothetical protein